MSKRNRKHNDPTWELVFATREDAKRYLADKGSQAVGTIVKEGHLYKVELLDVNECWDCGRRHTEKMARTVAGNQRTIALKAIFYAKGAAGESTDGFSLSLFRNGKYA